jgi:hypothetical protein
MLAEANQSKSGIGDTAIPFHVRGHQLQAYSQSLCQAAAAPAIQQNIGKTLAKHWQDIGKIFKAILGLRSLNNLIKMRLREREIIGLPAGSDAFPQSILIAHNQ